MPTLDPAAVRARAHEIWIKKGKRDGHSTEDWAQAERELSAEAQAKAAPVKAAVPAASSALAAKPATPVQQPTFRKGRKRR